MGFNGRGAQRTHTARLFRGENYQKMLCNFYLPLLKEENGDTHTRLSTEPVRVSTIYLVGEPKQSPKKEKKAEPNPFFFLLCYLNCSVSSLVMYGIHK